MNTAFLNAFKNVIGVEGKYQCDPDDSGNWTGGKVGEGILKGTKYGISASSFPNIDIKNLTLEDAKALYYLHWWHEMKLDEVSDPLIAEEIFDTGVNCGVKVSAIIVQKSLAFLGEKVFWDSKNIDGIIGPVTLDKINKWCIKDRISLHKALNGYQFQIYSSIVESAIKSEKDKREKYGRGWLKRIQYYRG